MSIDDRIKSAATNLVAGPILCTFVPAEHQQKLLKKVLPYWEGSGVSSGVSLIYEFAGGIAAILAGASTNNSVAFVVGTAASIEALIRVYGGSLDDCKKEWATWATLPVELAYSLLKKSREAYREIVA
ncbi:MAG: hypothetical protein V1702_03275 [Candidatus Woesearchaeota archaeon]